MKLLAASLVTLALLGSPVAAQDYNNTMTNTQNTMTPGQKMTRTTTTTHMQRTMSTKHVRGTAHRARHHARHHHAARCAPAHMAAHHARTHHAAKKTTSTTSTQG